MSDPSRFWNFLGYVSSVDCLESMVLSKVEPKLRRNLSGISDSILRIKELGLDPAHWNQRFGLSIKIIIRGDENIGEE